MLAMVAVAAVALPLFAPAGARAATFTLCDSADGSSPTIAQADALMKNQYSFTGFKTVTLPSPSKLTWKEDPFHNASWVLKLHQMYWTEPLWYAYTQTSDPFKAAAYRNQYIALLQSWYSKNPQSNPPSPWSWAYHSVAIRSMVVSCAIKRGISYSWTRAMADQHGAKLAESSFYLQTGNRALDQNIGLLDIGCARNNSTWKNTAVSRMNSWATHDVDPQGVSLEQSDGYNLYVYRRLDLASRALAACGLSSSTVSSQHDNMVNFIVNAETPSGYTVSFGDTGKTRIPYDWNNRTSAFNWMYTNGAAPLRPPTLPLYATYNNGYAFFRSGWGDTNTVDQQTHVMVRFGAPRANHGHEDATEVTMEAYGNKLLLDSGGPYIYDANNPYYQYFASERANNEVTIDQIPMRPAGWAYLRGQNHDDNMDYVSVMHLKYRSVTTWRRVLYDRRLNVMLVDDSLQVYGPVAFRQNWHLRADATVHWARWGPYAGFYTTSSGSNVAIAQLVGGKTQEVHRGATTPIQGWVTDGGNSKYAASDVQEKFVGRSARYISLIVPSPTGSTLRSFLVTNFSAGATGFSVDITLGGMTDHIYMGQTAASLSVLS
jgi:hypothetical protein